MTRHSTPLHTPIHSWDDAIGSTVTALGFHGFIGLIVLARVEDVRAGTFMLYESQRQKIARGKDLGVARAQNKGGVGLSFRYFDTAFGCCGVHLASDSKGRYVPARCASVMCLRPTVHHQSFSPILPATKPGPSCASACAMPATCCL